MSLRKWHILGVFFVFIFGSLLHFAYDWSGQNVIVGLFSPVNESTWEHLKLLFTPILLITILEFFKYGRKSSGFLLTRAISTIIGLITIITVFYTYVGIIGENYLFLDIATFLLGVLATYWFSYNSLKTKSYTIQSGNLLGLLMFILLTACFIFFTFQPPHINLFLDPVSGSYGT